MFQVRVFKRATHVYLIVCWKSHVCEMLDNPGALGKMLRIMQSSVQIYIASLCWDAFDEWMFKGPRKGQGAQSTRRPEWAVQGLSLLMKCPQITLLLWSHCVQQQGLAPKAILKIPDWLKRSFANEPVNRRGALPQGELITERGVKCLFGLSPKAKHEVPTQAILGFVLATHQRKGSWDFIVSWQ